MSSGDKGVYPDYTPRGGGTPDYAPRLYARELRQNGVVGGGGYTAGRFYPAHMNHDKAKDKARKKELPAPTDFSGAAAAVF